MYRQGDVLLVPIQSSLPKDAEPISEGFLVLAEGEATGHAHVIESIGSELLETKKGERYLTLAQETVLRHEEHAPIEIPEGAYKVIRQREYVQQERPRTVRD